jgi:hypothetical protein
MATVVREQVIDPIEDLPNADAEAPLVAIIHRRLPPDDQRRLSALRAVKEDRPLTPDEHAELLAYVERVERADAERAQALLDLSRRREVPLAALMTELGFASDA